MYNNKIKRKRSNDWNTNIELKHFLSIIPLKISQTKQIIITIKIESTYTF